MPSTNHSKSHSHSHSHAHSRTDTQTSAHKPHASKKPTSTTKSLPPQQPQSQPLPPQTTSKPQHDNNTTDILPPAPTLPPPTTEATFCASIRLQSRLSDLLETARLFVEFDEGTKNSDTYYDLTYFYHRELKHSVLSVLRALHHLVARIAEGIESPGGDGEDPPESPVSIDSKENSNSAQARGTSRDAKSLLAFVPKALREACLEVEREVQEVRERRKGDGWKELGREGRRRAWRGHCERLVVVVEGSSGKREREVERLRGEVSGEVGRLVRGE